MASYTTLLDVIKSNAANAAGIPMIDEVSRRHPFISRGAFRSIKGINFKTLVQTAASNTTGSFRTLNTGVAPATSTEENRLIETFPIQPLIQVDAQLAANSEDGAPAFIARKVKGILEMEFQAHEKQCFYGAASGLANSQGYPGLLDAYDATNFVTDAGGTTASTGSSVWFVNFGMESVTGVLANGGQFTFGPLRLQNMPDANNSGKYLDMYIQTLMAQVGLQVASVHAVARIKKITADSGHTLTDKMVQDTLALFINPGFSPNAVFMSLRSLSQLRDSRTATNPSGTEAPYPTSIIGIDGGLIPIYPTAGILNTESLTL
jgi:hypothetical protein